MNLFELFVKLGVDDEASAKIADISKKLGSGLKTAAKVGVAAVTAAATGVTALATSAIKNFAEYEQLVGGVDTLFKDASQKVQQYAAEAYRTAGMSANDYMANATAFSATLINSLGGDTEKAAEYANRAMVSMSDNANRMGTSIDSIVQTYQSLSRGNFAMLDNLKLGYGGTKQELQRLLKDAASYTDVQKEMGITVDETSMSFDNIVNAIAVVQGRLGIAGATAEEAATTIEGSALSMKASWNNLMTGIADDTADFDSLIENFVGSVDAFSDNVMPRVEQSLNGVVKLIDALLPKIAEGVPKFIANYAPKLIQAGANVLKSMVKGIKDNAKMLVSSAKDVFIQLINELPDLIPDVIDAGVELLSGVVEAIPDVAISVAKNIPKIVESICTGLIAGVIDVAKAVVSLFAPIVDESEEATKKLRNSLSNITPFAKIASEFARSQVDLSESLSESGRTIGEIDEKIDETEAAITKILSKALEEQKELREKDIKNIEEYNARIKALNDEKLSVYRDQQLAELRRAQLDIANADVKGLAELAGRAEAALNASNEAVEELYSDRLIAIENQYKAMGEVGSSAYQKALQDAKNQRDEDLRVNRQYYEESLKLANNRATELINIDTRALDALSAVNEEMEKAYEKYSFWIWDLRDFAESNDSIIRAAGLTDKAVARYATALDALDESALSAFLNTQAAIVDAGGLIDEASFEMVNNILSAFSGLPGEMGEISKESLLSVIDGLEEYIPELQNASEMTVEEIKTAIESYLNEKNGRAAASSYLRGMTNAFSQFNSGPKGLQVSIMGSINGSHRSGLDYVPYDGYVAELHKGERVLTASEAKSYGGNSFGDVVINITGSNDWDESTLARAVAEELQIMTERMEAVYA